MNGITIIEEHLCRVVELPALLGVCIFITLLCIGILAFYAWVVKNCIVNKKLVTICSALIIIIYIITLVIPINSYNEPHMEYTITVDDSVSFNDFYAKYEIISVDGDEYRVVEK